MVPKTYLEGDSADGLAIGSEVHENDGILGGSSSEGTDSHGVANSSVDDAS